ncbi:hypothetical protein [Gordonia rubripertincta]|uniref:hypothetical protein n=1 Tax=Gordonia rubripertincta TaxID=36822 RepID=UPI000B8D1DA3|nr:hypothetical protein [Gordonia rubripertincta]ASR05636.1 hypothetical protein GCWB2_24325 [Gordonia rubripertincta]
MTTSRAALTTIVAHLSDGTRAHIVGRIDAFPGHPAAGTLADSLTAGTGEAITDHDRGPFFVLVSVTWATPVTTHNLDTGEAVTKYVPGLLGPSGTSWYLAPVTASEAGFRLVGRCAAGYRTARLPEIPGIDVPRQVNVHDFPI